jgi:subtilisin family serine protease
VKLALLVAVTAVLAACAPSSSVRPTAAPASGATTRTASVETSAAGTARQILVTVRQSATLAAGLTGAPNQRYLQRRYGPSPSVDRVLTQLAHEHDLRRVEGWPIQSLNVYCEVLTVPEDSDLAEVLAALNRDPRVDLAQRMNLFNTQAARYDDPYLDLQSAATTMDVAGAHELATGRGVSIAIIDSAVDGDHPDLRGRVRLARNLVTDHPLGRNGEVHGTAVAGIIASAVNNREGIIGVAPDVSIAALRACWAVDENGLAAQCTSFSLAQALELALGLQPNVINLSLAGPDDPLLSRLLDQVTERGIVVVTAHPASAASSLAFPSSHPRVLTAHSSLVAANSDSPYTLAAPADEVLTTTPGAGYAFLTGNSLAAAHTTGVIALLMERQPDLDAERIAAILTATTTYSAGSASINACRAVARVAGTASCLGAQSPTRF